MSPAPTATKISFVWSPDSGVPGVRREAVTGVSLLAGGANSELHFRRKAILPGASTSKYRLSDRARNCG